MRKMLVAVFFYSISLVAKSQHLTVEGTAPNLYITHIVAPKENFYSVSRLYNQAPKSIASFNKIVMEKGLTIGQHVKIPLTAQNFDSGGSSNAKGANMPLTHIVAKSETLFRIGNSLHVTAESIRKWNHLTSDNIAAGTPLIIGYLKTDNAQTAAAAIKNSTTSGSDNNETAKKNADITEQKPNAAEPKKEAPLASAGAASGSEKQENQTETKKPDESAQGVREPKKNASEQNTAIAEKDTAIAVIPENPAAKPVKEKPAKQQETPEAKNEESKRINPSTEVANSSAGTFAEIYASQTSQKTENTKSGEAATFKSTSGWQDKKYYVLINDVTPGTIVKISSADNKAVYAKVLGSMPEMKENNGLLLRISNAAAANLGIIDPKFPVQVSYYQ